MKILYISYWSLSDPLTASTIFPYFPLMGGPEKTRITFYTFEASRDKLEATPFSMPGIEHRALHRKQFGISALSKFELIMRGRYALIEEARAGGYDLVFAKASMAGAFAHMVHTATGLPYVVESFEPHSEYMALTGVWPRGGFRFRFFAHYERMQKRHAQRIITVTHNYRNDMIAEGVPAERISVIPSITDLAHHRFDQAQRAATREKLGISADVKVGIYVGKFGGLYYDREAFELFKRAMEYFPGMHVIVLSPMDTKWIIERAAAAGIDTARLHVKAVQHKDVASYLSAADIAFSPIKPAATSLYQSPVKNGEYWANGLPILMTDLVADDHRLMRQGIGGSVFGPRLEGLDEALKTLENILADPGHRAAITELARKYKSLDLAREVYRTIF